MPAYLIPPTPYWENGQDYGTQVLTDTMREMSQREREEYQRQQEWDQLERIVPSLSSTERELLYEDLMDLMTPEMKKEYELILEQKRHALGIARDQEDSEFICV